MQNQRLQLFLAATLAASTAAFAPPTTTITPPSRIKSSLRYLESDELHHDLGSLRQSVDCAAEDRSTLTALDAEMDTFASPNDKRYSASDWLHNIANFHNSSILSQIRGPVQTITLWSTFVSLVYKLMILKGGVWTGMAEKMCLGSTPHSFIASTIGLLLVFRTNSAYQKFRVSECEAEVLLGFTAVLELCNNFNIY
jgi:hypothetical protein